MGRIYLNRSCDNRLSGAQKRFYRYIPSTRTSTTLASVSALKSTSLVNIIQENITQEKGNTLVNTILVRDSTPTRTTPPSARLPGYSFNFWQFIIEQKR